HRAGLRGGGLMAVDPAVGPDLDPPGQGAGAAAGSADPFRDLAADSQPVDVGDDGGGEGAIAVLRRGLEASPELTTGVRVTLAMGMAAALGRIALPVLIQQALDRGVLTEGGFDGAFVARACAVAAVVVVAVALVTRATYLR